MKRKIIAFLDYCKTYYYKTLSNKERNRLKLLAGLVLGGLLLRLVVFFLFPNPIAYDTDGYFFAGDFISTGDWEKGGSYFLYRRLFFPFILFLFKKIFSMPLLSYVLFNILLSTCTLVFIYLTCRNFKINYLLSIIVTFFFAFMRSHVLYATVVSPETMLVFFTTLSFYIFSYHLKDKTITGCVSKTFIITFLLHFVILLTICLFKPIFYPVAILVSLLYLIFFIAFKLKNKRLFAKLILLLFAGNIIFAGGVYTYDRISQNIINKHTTEGDYYCAGTIYSAVLPYFIHMDGGMDLGLKNDQELKKIVSFRKQKITEFYGTNFLRGEWKKNVHASKVFNIIKRYFMKNYDLPKDPIAQYISSYCGTYKLARKLLFEGIQHNWDKYIYYWMLPEILRVFIPIDDNHGHLRIGTFYDKTTYRLVKFEKQGKFNNDPHDWSHINEILDSKSVIYYFLHKFHSPSKIKEILSFIKHILNRVLFRYHYIFSTLFLVFIFIFPILIYKRKIKGQEVIALCYPLFYSLGLIFAYSLFLWLHGRHQMMFLFPITIIGAYCLQEIIEYLTKINLFKYLNK